ncbi:ferredoxin [Streptomyces albus]
MPARRAPGAESRLVRVEVDLTRCAGYGNCVDAAPEVFRMSDAAEVAEVTRPSPAPNWRTPCARRRGSARLTRCSCTRAGRPARTRTRASRPVETAPPPSSGTTAHPPRR